jgi:YVTN family beta-propeller protein
MRSITRGLWVAALASLAGLTLEAQGGVVATIGVGAGPFGVAADSFGGRVFVANQQSGTVSIIDSFAGSVLMTVGVGSGPTGIDVDPVRDRAYVTNRQSNTVSVMQGSTGLVVATVPVGRDPRGVAVDPAGNRVFVTNSRQGTVSVIDGALASVVATYSDGMFPFEVAFHGSRDLLYVSNFSRNTVTVMGASTGSVQAVIVVGQNPGAVAVDERTDRVYVTSFADGTVTVIDASTNAILAAVPVGTFPLYGLALDASGRRGYVTNFGGNNLSVLDLDANVVLDTIPVGSGPLGAAFEGSVHKVYVANSFDGTVSVIDAATNRAPRADAGADQVAAARADACAANVTLDGTGSSDPDGDTLSFRWTGPFGEASGPTPTVEMPHGASTVNLEVSDGKGGSATDTVRITVMDVTAPAISGVSATPAVLSPPNHKMVSVTVSATATDNCDPAPSVRIVEVSSNEPDNGPGDGNASPDWRIIGPLAVDLRAERSGCGTGRVYTITLESADASGNAARAEARVTVPHDSRKARSR